MKVKWIPVWLGLLIGLPLYSQQLISPFGGYIENRDNSLSFSLGEVVVHTLLGEEEATTQGFQQPPAVVIEETAINLDYASGLILDAANENGVFKLNGIEEYPNNRLLVLNRWGDIVYEAQPYQNDWRGTFEGQDLPQATYYFIFYPVAEQKTVVKGNIYLLRE